MKPEIKKQIILHLPYLAFVYLFGKVGQAFRLAQGADLSGKLLHIGQGFSAAFASAAPSFHPTDLLIGLAAAVIIRLVVYSQSIEFFDINYLLAQPDDQTAIFEYLCDLYNYLDSSIHVQFTYPNRKSDREQLARSFEMPPCNDGLDPIRQEQTDILKRQLARGNNGSVKTKYITYTIEADNLKAARARLSRISLDIQGYFKIMGAVSRVLDGKERLEVLHGIMHPDGERFNFDWKWLAAGGLSTKDFIAPSSFAFKNSRMFQMGGKLCAASFLQIITPELTDRILTDFLDTDSSLVVNVHIQALEQTEAVKMVKRKITDLDAMKIQEQKKAVRDGYDMDILPSDLATYGGAAKKLLQDLQSRNERYFLLTFLVLNYGDTKRKLENDVFRTAGVAQKHNCTLTRLDFQQERGLVSSLPLGENQIHITRGMTTSAVAIIVPFVTQELFQGGDSLYYGLNAKSGNMIMLDRKNARSPNGLVFGTPGGGKSFSCKREMIGVLLKTHDHVLVYNISTPVSSPQPGDLVFFVGTYDTPGVSHVGIYVGNSMMIHCGDPISYSNLNSSYWQAHFYAYARPPYN